MYKFLSSQKGSVRQSQKGDKLTTKPDTVERALATHYKSYLRPAIGQFSTGPALRRHPKSGTSERKTKRNGRALVTIQSPRCRRLTVGPVLWACNNFRRAFCETCENHERRLWLLPEVTSFLGNKFVCLVRVGKKSTPTPDSDKRWRSEKSGIKIVK